jgi:hypothetical protein
MPTSGRTFGNYSIILLGKKILNRMVWVEMKIYIKFGGHVDKRYCLAEVT